VEVGQETWIGPLSGLRTAGVPGDTLLCSSRYWLKQGRNGADDHCLAGIH
jgi:hypothetical protein